MIDHNMSEKCATIMVRGFTAPKNVSLEEAFAV